MPVLSHDSRYSRILRSSAIWALVALLACTTHSSVMAQGVKTKELPVDESMKGRRTEVSRALRSSAMTGEQQTLVDTYLRTYALPRWTLAKSGPGLPGLRAELEKDLANAQGASRQWANERTLKYLLAIGLRPDYSIPCRYNMILAAGELDDRSSARKSDPPVAMASALPKLLDTYEDKDGRQPDSIRFAALLGVVRHAQLGIADGAFLDARVVPAMLSLATTTTTTGLRSENVHNWFRVKAIECLGAIGRVGAQGEIVQALLGIINDKGDTVETRNEAARVLGRLDYQSGQGVDPASLVGALGVLTLDTCQRVSAAIQVDQDLIMADGGFGSSSGDEGDEGEDMSGGDEEGMDEEGGGGGGGSFGFDRDITLEQDARRLLDHRRRAKTGLGAVLAAMGDPKDPTTGVRGLVTGSPLEQKVTVLEGLIDELVDNLDIRELENIDQVQVMLGQTIAKLEAMIAG